MREVFGRVAQVAGLIVAGVVFAAAASGDTEAKEAERGGLLFRIHCASCHGGEGRGDGPVSPYLKIAPSDLTRLADPSTGTFPAERIHRSIDGRRDLKSHGRRDMPVWGLSFRVEGLDVAQEREVKAQIDALVAFLHTLQEREEP